MNPNDLAPGHNPDGLTIAQVGKGYRLTELEECGTLKDNTEVEWLDKGRWRTNRVYSGEYLATHVCHRVPITIPIPSRLGRLLPIVEPLPPVPEGCVRVFASKEIKWVPTKFQYSSDTHYTDIQLPTTEHS